MKAIPIGFFTFFKLVTILAINKFERRKAVLKIPGDASNIIQLPDRGSGKAFSIS
jgi:hypothetical protein